MWTFAFMDMGFFYRTQEVLGDHVDTYSYTTTSREKVIGAVGFMAQTRHLQQCALRAGSTGWLQPFEGISHVGHLQWKVHLLDKVAVCQRKKITVQFLLCST